jgi:hypothetical protein
MIGSYHWKSSSGILLFLLFFRMWDEKNLMDGTLRIKNFYAFDWFMWW